MSLEVLVKEGISLPLVEKSGIQSTMVVCNFQGYSIKSKVFDNDLNPKWNEVIPTSTTRIINMKLTLIV